MTMAHRLTQSRSLHFTLTRLTCIIVIAALIHAVLGMPAAGADYFKCYEGCTSGNGALKGSACVEEATTGDWHTTCTGLPTCPDRGSDVTVLSHHGGKIELYTSVISEALASLYGWNRFDLSGHLVRGGACDQLASAAGISPKKRNFLMLHVTSTRFNHRGALALVQSHPHAVAIHGCGRSCAKKTICIGGANTSQVNTFKAYVDTYKEVLPHALDAAVVKSYDTPACKARIRGRKPNNIVNRSASGNGGLQLEISKDVRKRLASRSVLSDLLRGVVYGGVAVAMDEVPLPITVVHRTEMHTAEGERFIRYYLRVKNADAISPSLFSPAPTLPPCGPNPKAARTWVKIYDASNHQYLHGFCDLSDSIQLNDIWFDVKLGQVSPSLVYVKLIDRQTNKTYQSNRIPIL